jgi:predicted Zn-dependent protease
LALARYQVQRGNYQQAQATVQQLLLVSPNHLEGKVLLGQIQFQQGKRTDGIDTFGRLASQNRFPVAYALLARALHASGDQQAAGEAVSTVLELAAGSAQMHMRIIDIQIGEGQREKSAYDGAHVSWTGSRRDTRRHVASVEARTRSGSSFEDERTCEF